MTTSFAFTDTARGRVYSTLKSAVWVAALLVFTAAYATATNLRITPTTLTFDAQVGGPAPVAQSVSVSDDTGIPLQYTVTVSTNSGGNWLSATPLSSTAPGGVESVSVNTTGLALGTYTGTVTFSAAGAGNSPQSLTVTLMFEEENPIVVDANTAPCVTPYSLHTTTISAAINAAPAGATIIVCPGTYPEQLTISKSLTLRGVTNTAANTGAAVIAVPPSPGLLVSNGFDLGAANPIAVQVLVQATNVNIVDVAVDGTSAFTGCSSPSLVGIGFDTGSSGTLRRVAVRNQNIPNGSGGYCGTGGPPDGIGIFSQTSGSVTVQDSSVRGFASGGFSGLTHATSIVIKATTFLPVTEPSGSNCVAVAANADTLQLSNNTVANCGVGIIMNFTAQGTITGNTVITHGSGIFCYDSCFGGNIEGNTLVVGVIGIGEPFVQFAFSGTTFQYNDISGAQDGLQVFGRGNTVSNNTINDASFVGIQGVTGNTVSNNTFLNVTTLTQ